MSMEQRIALRRAGLSEEQADLVLNEAGQGNREAQGILDSIGEFAEGVALGGVRSVTSLGEGLGSILSPVPFVGRGLKRLSRRTERGAERLFDPEGGAGAAGEFVGRLGGEIGTTVGTLGLGKAITASRFPAQYARFQKYISGSPLKGAVGATVAESPLSVLRATSYAQERGTDFGYELGMEVAGSALGGAFVGRRTRPADPVTRGRFGRIHDFPEPGKKVKEPTGRRQLLGGGRLKSMYQKGTQGLMDRYIPLRMLARQVGGLEGEKMISGALAQMLGSNKRGQQYLSTNLVPWLDEHGSNLDDINNAAKIRREMVLRTLPEDRARGPRMAHVNDAELKKLYDEVMSDEYLVDRTNDLHRFFRNNLEARRAAGIDPEEYYQKIIASSKSSVDDYYTPMVPISTRELDKPKILTRVDAFQPRGLKGMRDSPTKVDAEGRVIRSEPLEDPIEMLALETLQLYDDIGRKRVGDTLFELMGENVELDGIVRAVTDADIKAQNINPQRIWTYKDRGQEYKFHVLDEDLFDLLKMMPEAEKGRMMKLASGAANWKRKFITLLPDFAVMATMRDVPLYAQQRVIQRGSRSFMESGAGGAIGAVGGAATGDTPEERLERAIQGGLAGLGIGLVAKPTAEIGQALGTIARAKINASNGPLIKRIAPIAESLLGGLGDELGMDPKLWEEFVREGGVTAGLSYGRKDAAKLVKNLMNKEERATIFNSVGRGIDILESIGMVAENAPRLAQYRALRSGAAGTLPGASTQEAIWAAQDVTLPFALRGKWKSIQTMAQVTPFFNASLQAWSKLFRVFRGDPKKTMGRGVSESMLAMGTAITAPTLSLWMVNKDNPEYWDRPLWERNMFWLLPKPEGGFYRIPKPFELGYAFASLPERALEAAARAGVIESAAPEGSEAAKDMSESVRAMATSPITGMLPIPAIAAPLLEIGLNKDFFRWKPIVPEYLAQRPIEGQVRPTTPLLARAIGEASGVSPLKVQAVVNSMGGTMGRRVMQAVDIAGAVADYPTPASQLDVGERWNQVTGLSRFNTQQYSQGNIEFASYQVLRNSKNILDQFNRMVRANVDERALRLFAEDYADELRIARATGSNLRAMNKLREERNKIMGDHSVPQQRLRNDLDEFNRRGYKLGIQAFRNIDRIIE